MIWFRKPKVKLSNQGLLCPSYMLNLRITYTYKSPKSQMTVKNFFFFSLYGINVKGKFLLGRKRARNTCKNSIKSKFNRCFFIRSYVLSVLHTQCCVYVFDFKYITIHIYCVFVCEQVLMLLALIGLSNEVVVYEKRN